MLSSDEPPHLRDSCLQVLVRDNNVDQALKALKTKMQRDGIFLEMQLRGNYETPSDKRASEQAAADPRPAQLARRKPHRKRGACAYPWPFSFRWQRATIQRCGPHTDVS